MSSKQDFDLDAFLPYQLAVLASRTSRAFASIYAAEFGLTIPEWRVIAHLSRAGNVSVREIHARVDMDKSKVTRAVQRLEFLKLVKKQQNTKDRRLVALSLTAKGHATIQKISPKANDFAETVLAPLSPQDTERFKSLIKQLIDAGEKSG